MSAKSEVFKTMFFEEKATNDKEFVITNASLGAFKVMLKYVCYEKFILDDPIDYSLPIEVFKLGHRFQLKRLLKMIEHSLTKIITINNLVEVYELAKTYQLNTLTKSWNCFVNRNSGDILSFVNLLMRWKLF